jgi:hypothetical protein
MLYNIYGYIKVDTYMNFDHLCEKWRHNDMDVDSDIDTENMKYDEREILKKLINKISSNVMARLPLRSKPIYTGVLNFEVLGTKGIHIVSFLIGDGCSYFQCTCSTSLDGTPIRSCKHINIVLIDMITNQCAATLCENRSDDSIKMLNSFSF